MLNFPQELLSALGIEHRQTVFSDWQRVPCYYDIHTDQFKQVTAEQVADQVKLGTPFVAISREDYFKRAAIIKQHQE